MTPRKAAHACDQGSGFGLLEVLGAVRVDTTLDTDGIGDAGAGATSGPRKPSQVGRPLGMQSVCMLLHQLPELLVEQRSLLGARGFAPGVPLAGRFAR